MILVLLKARLNSWMSEKAKGGGELGLGVLEMGGRLLLIEVMDRGGLEGQLAVGVFKLLTIYLVSVEEDIVVVSAM